MRHKKNKRLPLLLGLMLSAIWCWGNNFFDGYSHIQIKEAQVQGVPRTNSIVASINGHTLSVVFLENLGQVHVEVDSVSGGETQYQSTPTPDGMDFFITDTGSYIVYFNLANGDVYYGEFEVTD